MAQPSQSDPRFHLESQVRECYGRCAYTHKIHERMAERHANHQWLAKWFNIVLSALIAGGAVSAIFKAETGLLNYAEYATAALAILSLIYNAYQKDLDPGALAQRHRETASDIWNVRESYLSLITDVLNDEVPIEQIREKRDELRMRRFHPIDLMCSRRLASLQEGYQRQTECSNGGWRRRVCGAM